LYTRGGEENTVKLKVRRTHSNHCLSVAIILASQLRVERAPPETLQRNRGRWRLGPSSSVFCKIQSRLPLPAFIRFVYATLLFPGSSSTRSLLCPSPKRHRYDNQRYIKHTSQSQWQLDRSYWHCSPLPASIITSIPQGLLVSSHVRLTTTSGSQGNCSCVRGSNLFYYGSRLISLCTLHQGCNEGYKSENVSVELMGDSPFHLRGSFPGPQDSPYEDGNFDVVSSTIILSTYMI
jgi:hypothetical protein